MCVIFLDINGVLNSTAFYRRRGPRRGGGIASLIDPHAIARLNRLLDATGAAMVLTSTWRRGDLLEQAKEAFRAHGVHCDIMGTTPDLFHRKDLAGRRRGAEIAAWLQTYTPACAYVIIDDGSDMGPLAPRLVQIDHTVGLQDADVDRAIAILREQQ